MKHEPKDATQGRRRTQRLSDLCLSERELRCLRRQGTVCRERRRGGIVFKLRFRMEDGRQQVRYIGKDSNVVAVIRRELQELQRHRHEVTNLRRLDAEARRLLRQIKEDSRQTLANHGLHYHGFAIRKCSCPTLLGNVDDEVVD